MPAAGDKPLERYDLIERVAVGGMAEVYRAKAYGPHGFEKTLAIKRILPELAKDREFENRFIAEAKLAVQLTHTNIVQVFDFGRFAGSLFIAMEYVAGLDLAAMLKRYRDRGQPIPLPAAFQIAIEIMRGLDYAHQHGVVHRDVSPSNILLSRAGEVKIADFGIAVAATAAEPVLVGRPSRQRRIMGKWRYMSPEQTQGETLSTQSDLFSAAAVLYELFTGKKLFPGDEAEDIIDNIHRMAIPPASEQRAGLPPRLDEVLWRALARAPGKRPLRAAEMQRELTEISYESSIVATDLDVAEALAQVGERQEAQQGPSAPASGLDDLIRQQLGDSGDVARHTAVGDALRVAPIPAARAEPIARPSSEPELLDRRTEPAQGDQSASFVKVGLGEDGITMWELDSVETEQTIAAGPSALKGKRSGSVGAMIHDRSGTAATALAVARPPSRWPWIALAGGALAVLGVAVFGLDGRERTGGRVAVALADAGAPLGRATLLVASLPSGATVYIDGEALAGQTPLSVDVAPDRAHELAVELPGYRRFVDEQISIPAGQTVRVRAQLVPTRSSLRVATTPPGATVSVDGEVLGVTPLEAVDLAPGNERAVTLTLPGYQPASATVDLAAGEVTAITRELRKARTPQGSVLIFVDEGWAEIYWRGRKIGRATTREPLTLPTGRHRLKLVNPVTRQQSSLTVDIRQGETTKVRAKL